MQTGKAGRSANSPSLLSHVRSGVTALSVQYLWKSDLHFKAPGVLAWTGLQGSSTGRLVGKVLLLLEGSPDLSHISTFSCFCAKTRPCVCCPVHQGKQTERSARNLTLHLPCCCYNFFHGDAPAMLRSCSPLLTVCFPGVLKPPRCRASGTFIFLLERNLGCCRAGRMKD